MTDDPRLSLAGRALMPLAVALTLLWNGTNAQPDMGGMPPRQPTVQAARQLQHGVLGGQAPLVRAAARHSQRNRRGNELVAVVATALAGTVVAATRRPWVAGALHLDRRLFALGPRAPPFPS